MDTTKLVSIEELATKLGMTKQGVMSLKKHLREGGCTVIKPGASRAAAEKVVALSQAEADKLLKWQYEWRTRILPAETAAVCRFLEDGPKPVTEVDGLLASLDVPKRQWTKVRGRAGLVMWSKGGVFPPVWMYERPMWRKD